MSSNKLIQKVLLHDLSRFVTLELDFIPKMSLSLAESPYSVNVRPTPDPDTTTLSRMERGIKITEPKGQIVKSSPGPVGREFILKNEGNVSVVFNPSSDLDLIAFQRPSTDVTHYVARNGSYVEVGAVNGQGMKSGAQYSLSDGTMTFAVAEIGSFGKFDVPAAIGKNIVSLIRDVFIELKSNKTPSPLGIGALEGIFTNAVTAQPIPASL